MAEQEAHLYLQTHQLHGEMLKFGLGVEEQELLKRAAVSGESRAAKTLVKEGALRVTAIALLQGNALERHEVAGPCSIECRRGRVKLSAAHGEAEIGEGDMVSLGPGVAHTAQALEDSLILVTIAMI